MSGDMDSEVFTLLDEVKDCERSRRTRTRVLFPIWLVAYMALVVVIGIVSGKEPDLPFRFLFVTLAFVTVIFLLVLPFPKHKRLLRRLGEADDLRAIGPLIDAQNGLNDHSTEVAVVAALTRLLPRMKPSDKTLLTAGQLERLEKILVVSNTARSGTYGAGSEFSVAVIRALEQVGSQNAVSVLETVASGKVITANPENVSAIARECLPGLKARLHEGGETLLRPVSGDSATTLVRPASDTTCSDEERLLRTVDQ